MTNKRKEDLTSTVFLRLVLKSFYFLTSPDELFVRIAQDLVEEIGTGTNTTSSNFVWALVRLDNIYTYIQTNFAVFPIDHLRYIKIQLGSLAYRTQTKEIEWPCLFLFFFCLCPLGLAIKLNPKISKVAIRQWIITSLSKENNNNNNNHEKFWLTLLKSSQYTFV